ncbi:site-specific integrase [Qipengyuania sp. GH25]|uniref:Site-specific integrase n=1 Tax=Qipengyuania pacifica TaxID=2860199 RepID=A0ABS7JK47_9SPHN|nr:site-specific integrase [Qipengyuania aerophila]MBX7489762.1 site-specific integrase [Qipengyuania aerophila]
MTMDPLVDIVAYNPHAMQMSIASVPADIARNSPLPIGFRFIVDGETRRPLPGFFDYLLSVAENYARSRTGRFCENTNRTYVALLKPIAEMLMLEGRPYEYLDDDILDAVVSSMIGGLTIRGEPFAKGTIHQVIDAAWRCVQHTNGVGLSEISLDRDAAKARAWGVDSIYDRDGQLIPEVARCHRRRVMTRPLDRRTITSIEGSLVHPSRWIPGGPTSRSWLTFQNGRRLGLRLVENTGIHVDDVMRLTVVDQDLEYQFPIRRTKGADRRDVLVDGRQILEWQTYVREERAACVSRAKEACSDYEEPPTLLVNGLASGTQFVGRPTRASTIQRDFRVVQERLGLVTRRWVPDPEGGLRQMVVLDHCYHDLRHTCAFALYDLALMRGGSAARDPIAFVQFRLGHARRQTTENIYLFPDRSRVAALGDMAEDATQRILGV